MLQRNDTGQPVTLPTVFPPVGVVNPGDTVDVDVELAGFSAVKGKATADTPTGKAMFAPEPTDEPAPVDAAPAVPDTTTTTEAAK